MIKKIFTLISLACCIINFYSKCSMKSAPAQPIDIKGQIRDLEDTIRIIIQTKDTIEAYVGKVLAEQENLEEQLAKVNQKIAEKNAEIERNEAAIRAGVARLKGENKVLGTHFMWRYFILKTLNNFPFPGYERNAALEKTMEAYKKDLDKLKAEEGMTQFVTQNEGHFYDLVDILGVQAYAKESQDFRAAKPKTWK